MKVLLISANTETINMPALPMGLGCVAAALRRRRHDCRFLDLMSEGSDLAAVEKVLTAFRPKLIGISIRNIDDQVSDGPRFMMGDAQKLVSACKRISNAPVVLGGAGYSMFPESALLFLGADMGIQGEGETAMPLLVERISSGRDLSPVPGLYLRGLGRQSQRTYEKYLDRLPLPAPDLFDLSLARKPDSYLPFQTRRGCPLSCSYCSTPTIEGRLIRKRSGAKVVKELRSWRRAGFSRIFFVDNTFNLPHSYALDLSRKIAAAGLDLSWRCILYPGQLNELLVRTMARAGCQEASLGFESGTQTMLDALRKRFRLEDVQKASRLLADYGIKRMGFLMLGGPGETPATVADSLRFAEGLDLDSGKVTIGIRIYPYTRLARTARAQGMIAPDDDLLTPRFYIARGLAKRLRRMVGEWIETRPNWFV